MLYSLHHLHVKPVLKKKKNILNVYKKVPNKNNEVPSFPQLSKLQGMTAQATTYSVKIVFKIPINSTNCPTTAWGPWGGKN